MSSTVVPRDHRLQHRHHHRYHTQRTQTPFLRPIPNPIVKHLLRNPHKTPLHTYPLSSARPPPTIIPRVTATASKTAHVNNPQFASQSLCTKLRNGSSYSSPYITFLSFLIHKPCFPISHSLPPSSLFLLPSSPSSPVSYPTSSFAHTTFEYPKPNRAEPVPILKRQAKYARNVPRAKTDSSAQRQK